MKKVLGILIGSLFVASVAQAVPHGMFQGKLWQNSTLAISSDPVRDLNLSGEIVAAQVIASSASPVNSNWIDGTVSTGAFSVITPSALSASSATLSITFSSTSASAITGQTVTLTFPGGTKVFTAGVDFPIDAKSTVTACGFAAAMNKYGVFNSTCNFSASGSGISYSTAPAVGSQYNTYTLTSSTLTAISSGTFSGNDNALACVNGTCVRANRDWTVVSFATTTATNLKNAFATSVASLTVSVGVSSNVVTATSTAVGVATKYALTSSATSALTITGATMTGGTEAGYSLSTSVIQSTSVYGVGLAVLYTSGTITINPLVNQTTYYAIPVATGGFRLALTSTGAVAGAYITLTSSTTGTTAHTFTVTPLAISGTSVFTWQQSEDGANWQNLSISTATFSGTTALSAQWAFGTLYHRFLRLDISALTTGAQNIAVWLNEGSIYAGN